MTRLDVDYGDVQGIVRFGYKKMTEAAYLLVRVRSAAAARRWLRSAPITSALSASPPPSTAMQVAFSAAGLRALGVSPDVLAGFSSEFLVGMTGEDRARRLGDVGINASSRWEWGGDASTNLPHLVVMCFAEPHNGGLEALLLRTMGAEWNEAFDVLRRLDTGDLGGVEPFGFADGLSQPELDWNQQRHPSKGQLEYGNAVALGEFLLGYPNEYKKYTDRPTLAADVANQELLPAGDAPERKDLGRNGTYLVVRQLRQDVRTFWQFVNRQSGNDFAEADRLAAAFVGRSRAGDPLVPVRQQATPGTGAPSDPTRLNQFTFDDDPLGARCPIGAHIRRSNPRNADLPGHPTGLTRLMATLGLGRKTFDEDLTSSVRFHRVLRRGREYGPALSPADALAPAPDNDPERGLQFVCINANISRQFEFLQNAWIMNSKFSGLNGESDPLLGGREPIAGCPVTDSFTLPGGDSVRRRVSGLPQFVTVRGGAYFFLPSLRALRYFAAD